MKKARVLDLVAAQSELGKDKARSLIMAGAVSYKGRKLDKPGEFISSEAQLHIVMPQRFVGRGGYKMEGAINDFCLHVEGMVALDIGASTGGFTDCLLQHGAARVYAVDVGTNQLDWKLRSDERVIAREKFNARYMQPEDIGEPVDLVVIDVSFISLTHILPAAFKVLKPEGRIVCLIKPQFELQPEQIGKGGIVVGEELRQQAVDKIRRFVEDELQQYWLALSTSPITGQKGNVEFLALLASAEQAD